MKKSKKSTPKTQKHVFRHRFANKNEAILTLNGDKAVTIWKRSPVKQWAKIRPEFLIWRQHVKEIMTQK